MSYPKLLGSSANEEKISLTLKAFVPLILFVVSYFKIDLSPTEIEEAISVIGVMVAGLTFLYGLGRKIVNGLKEKKDV